MKTRLLLFCFVVLALPLTAHAQAPLPTDVKTVNGVAPIPAVCGDERKYILLPITDATSGNIQQRALSSTQVIYICGGMLWSSGTVSVKWTYGTGANCVTGTADMTGAVPMTAQTGYAITNAGYANLFTLASNALCLNLSANISVTGWIVIVQQVPPP